MKGLFIDFEGVDASGKKTQARLLEKSLKGMGLKVEMMSYPSYGTPFGDLAAAYLRGEFGSLKEVSPEIAAILFSTDRYQKKDKIFDHLKKGKIIITDRYTASNMGFHGAKFEGKKRSEFIKWVEIVESRLPKPDIVFFLDMPVEAAQDLQAKKKERKYLKGKKDIHEIDVKYQKRVRETYLEIAKTEKNWVVIKCTKNLNGKWKVKSPEEIHEEVMKTVKSYLGK